MENEKVIDASRRSAKIFVMLDIICFVPAFPPKEEGKKTFVLP